MPQTSFSRPRDTSLQAYKDWINGIVKLFNPNAKETMTEKEWRESWEKFWSKAKDDQDDSETPAVQK